MDLYRDPLMPPRDPIGLCLGCFRQRLSLLNPHLDMRHCTR